MHWRKVNTMATFFELNDREQEIWAKWLEERPPQIRAMAKKYPPNVLFRMKSSGHRVYMVSYEEDGTVTVAVTGKFNFVVQERNVFGIDPDDLEECDLPEPDEKLGSMNIPFGVLKEEMGYGRRHHQR
jgi:hypothetical protein